MNERFHGKTAIVTGGAQGIGKAIARRLLSEGAGVMIADIDPAAAEEAAAEFASLGKIAATTTDVASESSVENCVRETIRVFGRIDLLVNNAAIASPAAAPLWELSLADWDRVIAVNLTGAFLCVKHCAAQLSANKGAVLNIASTRCLQSEPDTEAYAASKGGIAALTHAMAMSFAGQARVNCVSPGWIETCEWRRADARTSPAHSLADESQHPCGRVGVPDDIASIAAFLLSQEAAFITGQNFVVDGGMTRKMIYA